MSFCGGWWGGGGLQSHFRVQPNFFAEVVLCCVVVGVVTIDLVPYILLFTFQNFAEIFHLGANKIFFKIKKNPKTRVEPSFSENFFNFEKKKVCAQIKNLSAYKPK